MVDSNWVENRLARNSQQVRSLFLFDQNRNQSTVLGPLVWFLSDVFSIHRRTIDKKMQRCRAFCIRYADIYRTISNKQPLFLSYFRINLLAAVAT